MLIDAYQTCSELHMAEKITSIIHTCNATGSIKPVFYTGLLLAAINFIMILTCLRITDQDVAAVEGK